MARTVCKFWKQGKCNKGANCNFLHGDPGQRGGGGGALADFVSDAKLDELERQMREDLSDYTKFASRPALSSYGLGQPAVNNVISGRDLSFEEARVQYMAAVAANAVPQFERDMHARQQDMQQTIAGLRGRERMAARWQQKSAENPQATIRPFTPGLEESLAKIGAAAGGATPGAFGAAGFGAGSGAGAGGGVFGGAGAGAFGGGLGGGLAFGALGLGTLGFGSLGSLGFGSLGFGSLGFGAAKPLPFGAPAASAANPLPFGAPAASAAKPLPFGAPAASAPAPLPFGAPSQPLAFGTLAFGSTFGKSAALGAPGALGSAFGSSGFGSTGFGGAAGAGSVFGSSGFGLKGFGGLALPFGAAAPATLAFGAAPAALPFGAAPAAAPATLAFGAPPAALPFGAAPAAAPAALAFGAAPAALPFGAAPAAAAALPFGAPTPQLGGEPSADLSEYAPQAIAAFEAPAFQVGLVPDIPPPPALCT